MAINKYAEELKKEKDILSSSNPFSARAKVKPQEIIKEGEDLKRTPHFDMREKPDTYFGLILTSDFQDIEMEIRGLYHVRVMGDDGKDKLMLERRNDHYLSDDGAQDLLFELKGHLSSDIKLGVLTQDEFLKTQDIIRKNLVSYVWNNLERLGMDTEQKQRKAATLLVMLLNRIRAVYSRSIAGLENERSHGDIKLSGELDSRDDRKLNLEDLKN